MNKFEMQTPPNMLEFRHTSIANEWVMRITADRRIEVNEDVEVTEAAKKVLEAVQHMLTPQPERRSNEHLEPVAWMRQDGQRVTTASDRHNYPDYETRYSIPLYTTPPQRTWVGLTDEEAVEVMRQVPHLTIGGLLSVEAKLKEKNTK